MNRSDRFQATRVVQPSGAVPESRTPNPESRTPNPESRTPDPDLRKAGPPSWRDVQREALLPGTVCPEVLSPAVGGFAIERATKLIARRIGRTIAVGLTGD